MIEELVSAFKRCGFSLGDLSVQTRLEHLLQSLEVTPEWAAKRYEVFLSSREYSREVTDELIDAFEEFARQQHRKENRHGRNVAFASVGTQEDPATAPVLHDNTNLQQLKARQKTPTKQLKPHEQLQQSATPNSAFHNRTQRGTIASSFNAHLDISTIQGMDIDGVKTCSVVELGRPSSDSQVFMMDRLQDKVAFLEDRIVRFSKAVEASESCSVAHPVDVAAQDSVWVVGRICCDSEGRLNENSLLLEGSITHSQGHRVRLDVSKLAGYRLFPGQIVAVEGINPSGQEFKASKMVTSMPAARSAQASTSPPSTDVSVLSMVVACGPFSVPESLTYEPLQELLQYCSKHRPNVLLLLGPFVDAEHPLIKAGTIDKAFNDVFEEMVCDYMVPHLDGMHCVLVPSTRDVHHLPVFPQPAFEAAALGGVEVLGNPSTFMCNGVTFGVTTTDVLKHLSGQEVGRGNAGSNRMAGLASHILGQQSYYPIYPPVIGTMLDTSLGSGLQLPATPDVLIMPSDLNSFAKLVPFGTEGDSDVMCINPGRLVKGSNGGSFTHLRIAGGAKQVESRIDKCCKVDIIRI